MGVCLCESTSLREEEGKKTKDKTACSIRAHSQENCLNRIRGSSDVLIPGNYTML